MLHILYSEINVFCIAILISLLYRVKIGIDKRKIQCLFTNVIASGILLFVSDICWGLVASRYWKVSVEITYLVNYLYYISSGILALTWFIYSETELESELMKNKKYKCLCYIPTLILVVVILLTHKTHWIFYISEDNEYHRGKWYIIHLILTYGYIVFNTIHALWKAVQKENYLNKAMYLNLASFGIMPILFGAFQVIYIGLPILGMGITLAILQVYINSMERMISLDPLTQLKNRGQLLKYLSCKMQNYDKNKKLYLFILDADYFKLINDQYGHIEGDVALVRIANALKKIGNKQDYFISRYGGDEFILICELENKEYVDRLCKKINDTITKMNEEAKAEYVLSVSIGYAKYEASIKSVPEFIQIADKMLYQVKAEKHH